jgi:hypothetical protein
MSVVDCLRAEALYLVIGAALIAGLAASYGRELEARRKPDGTWWARRLLIMPILAIAAAAATDMLHLSASMAAFTTAMLSLGGYDVLSVIERRWLRRLEAAALVVQPNPSEAGEKRP